MVHLWFLCCCQLVKNQNTTQNVRLFWKPHPSELQNALLELYTGRRLMQISSLYTIRKKFIFIRKSFVFKFLVEFHQDFFSKFVVTQVGTRGTFYMLQACMQECFF